MASNTLKFIKNPKLIRLAQTSTHFSCLVKLNPLHLVLSVCDLSNGKGQAPVTLYGIEALTGCRGEGKMYKNK